MCTEPDRSEVDDLQHGVLESNSVLALHIFARNHRFVSYQRHPGAREVDNALHVCNSLRSILDGTDHLR